MHLITMAHYGEAQGVIEKFKLKKLSPELYQNEEMVLLLTGEGPFDAATKTALTIPKFPFKEIINLGIAGANSEGFKVGDFFAVRTIYLVTELKPQFRTFQISDKGPDCITSFERILDPEKAQVLRGIGQLIDREAWGVAFAAKSAGLPIKCFKLVSDIAGTLKACELIREDAEKFGEQLALELEKILNVEKHKPDDSINLPGFYFTFTTEHKFKNLLQKLAIKYEQSLDETIKNLKTDSLRSLDILPKERTKRLLNKMEDLIDPTRLILDQNAQSLLKAFAEKDIKLQIDPTWENPKVSITFQASSDEELHHKANQLSKLSIKSYQSLMSGDFHVE